MRKQPMVITDSEQTFAHRQRYFKGLLCGLLACALLFAAGCGDDEETATEAAQPGTSSTTTSEDPGDTGSEEDGGSQDGDSRPDPDIADADAEAAKVIDDWSSALAEGDVEGAAKLFAQPSIAENGNVLIKIETLDDAIAFNETLPCGAILQKAETTGRFTTATFELTDRPGGACGGGTGGIAATSFVIEDGKIAEWRRVTTSEERGGAPRGRET